MKSLFSSLCIICLNFSLLAKDTETCYSREYDDSWFKDKNSSQSFQKINLKKLDYQYDQEEGSFIYIDAWTRNDHKETVPYQAGFDFSEAYKDGKIFCESTNGDAGKGYSGCIYIRLASNKTSILVSPVKYKKDDNSKGIYINTTAVELVRCLGAWGDDLDCYGTDRQGNIDTSKSGIFQVIKWSPKASADKTYLLHKVECQNN